MVEEIKDVTSDEAGKDKKKSKTGIKNLSKLGIILATVEMIAIPVLKWAGILKEVDIGDVIKIAIGLVAVWTPGFISIWLDKIAAAFIAKFTGKVEGSSSGEVLQ